jgi:small subunit ribosomal protein S6
MAVAENAYEAMFILDPNRYAREAAEITGKLAKTVEKLGGSMLVARLWDDRRMAYPIRGQRKGTYWLSYFRLDSSKVDSFNEQIQRNDAVLRHLVLKVDPRIIDTLVAHASSSEQKPAPIAQPGARDRDDYMQGGGGRPRRREEAAV